MFSSELSGAVNDFAALVLPLSEKDLEREWIWKDHDEEGIRFAFFVTLQELRHLAVTLSTLRSKPTPAQHILSQYHAAYMDLQAALLGLSVEDADRAPADEEWSARRVYAHILSAEINFTASVRYALEKHRAGAWTPQGMADEDAIRLIGMIEEAHDALLTGPLEAMLVYHRIFIRRSPMNSASSLIQSSICHRPSGRRHVSLSAIDCIVSMRTSPSIPFKRTKHLWKLGRLQTKRNA
jgi:hypothetical protein